MNEVKWHPSQSERRKPQYQNVIFTPEFASWNSILQRCHGVRANASHRLYKNRGIKVCAAWRESFFTFLKDLGPRPEGCILGRIDHDGDYEPGNTRWVTKSQNSKERNRSGKRQCNARI